jgi:hypothetical protein
MVNSVGRRRSSLVRGGRRWSTVVSVCSRECGADWVGPGQNREPGRVGADVGDYTGAGNEHSLLWARVDVGETTGAGNEQSRVFGERVCG